MCPESEPPLSQQKQDMYTAVEKKLKLASDLFDFALNIKMEQIRQKNPQMDEKEIRAKALALIEKANQ